MSILDKLTERKQGIKTNLARLYRPLLERLANATGEPTSKDVENLDNLTNALDLNQHQVESDIDAVKRLQSLVEIAEKEDEYRADYKASLVGMEEHYKYIHRERMRLDSETVDVEIAKGQVILQSWLAFFYAY